MIGIRVIVQTVIIIKSLTSHFVCFSQALVMSADWWLAAWYVRDITCPSANLTGWHFWILRSWDAESETVLILLHSSSHVSITLGLALRPCSNPYPSPNSNPNPNPNPKEYKRQRRFSVISPLPICACSAQGWCWREATVRTSADQRHGGGSAEGPVHQRVRLRGGGRVRSHARSRLPLLPRGRHRIQVAAQRYVRTSAASFDSFLRYQPDR